MNEIIIKPSKTTVQSVWMLWEKAFALSSRFRGAGTTHFGICSVMLKKHRGQPIVCEDSTVIQPGEWVGELHLDNGSILKLIQTEGSNRAALQTARMLRQSMRQINEAFETQSEFKQVKAVLGITLLHRGIIHGLGFEQQNLQPGFFRRMTTIYLRLLLSALHPEGRERIGQRTEQLVPMRLVHSRASLKQRFSPAQKMSG
ncbi:YkoP family protein [Paenibacillus sp. BAC0078]